VQVTFRKLILIDCIAAWGSFIGMMARGMDAAGR